MGMERRGQLILFRRGVNQVFGRNPPAKRSHWLGEKSRMSREAPVRFCEGLGVKLPRATRLVGLEPQNANRGSVSGDEARFEIFLDVADGSFLEEISVPLFTLTELLLVAQPFQFRRRTSSEDAHGKQFARLRGHRSLIEDRQVTQMLAIRVAQRHAQVTFNPPFDERLVVGELEPYPG